MNGTVNRVMLLGNVGAEPECQTTSGGKFVAKFSLATSRGKDKDPDWHRVTCWEKTAEIINQYVHKGDKLHVEGRIEYRKHEDKWYTDIIAERVTLLFGGGEKKSGSGNPFED